MAGIGAAAQAQPQDPQAQVAPAPADQSQDQSQDQGGDPQPNVTPEEQAAYNEFVVNGMKLFYRGNGNAVQVNPAVLDQLKGKWDSVKPSLGEMPQEEKPLDPKNPIDNLAVATVSAVLALEASATQAGKQIDPAVLFHGASELMEQLADISATAGIHDFSTDELTGAANRAAMLYGVSSKTQNKQQALAEFDQFLKTQGDQLGSTLGAIAQENQGGGGGGADEETSEPSDNPQEEDEEQQ